MNSPKSISSGVAAAGDSGLAETAVIRVRTMPKASKVRIRVRFLIVQFSLAAAGAAGDVNRPRFKDGSDFSG
jgi:hypothetical protein